MTILSETIKRLHLRADSPYPSQRMEEERAAEDTRDMIRQWREAQRVKLVPPSNDEDIEDEST